MGDMNKNPQIVATVVTVEYHNKNTGHDEIGSFDVRIDIQKLVSGIAYRAVQNKSNRTVAGHGAIEITPRHMMDGEVIDAVYEAMPVPRYPHIKTQAEADQMNRERPRLDPWRIGDTYQND